MKVSKERKVLLILFVLGLVGLGIDRMFFAPAEAAASPRPEETGAAPPAKDAKAEAAQPAPSGPSFADRLNAKTVWTGVARDAFEAPKEWVGARLQQDDQPAEVESEFVKSHKLFTVLIRTDKNTHVSEPLAVIGGATYRVGNVVDGYRITELHAGNGDDQWALFERNEERVKLRVAASKPAGSSLNPADKFPVGEPGSMQMGPPAPPSVQNPPGGSVDH